MKILEILDQELPAEEPAVDQTAVQPEQPATQVQPLAQAPATPAPLNQPVYADNKQMNVIISALENALPHGKFTKEAASGSKQIRSIRARGISIAELKSAMLALGATVTNPDAKQVTASSSFPANSFLKDNILYTIVIGMKGVKADDETSTGIGRKELTPAGLGIDGKKYDKETLISVAKKAVISKFEKRDPILASTLIALLDNAATGGNTPLAEDQMAHIADYLGIVSQDFGEILAPILIMQPDDEAELPNGNYPLVDVKLPNMNLSVKALTGSGTSFRTISNLMDKYEASIGKDKDKVKKYNILRQFHPGTGGNNTDKIIRAAAAADIPEYKKLLSILGVKNILSFDDITSALSAKLGNADYTTFLKTFYPMMVAGPWGKPVGLPADGNYYLGKTKELKREKSAGKPSYTANPVKGGADIITYSLGVGLLNYIKRGDHSLQYKEMMTDIVNKADAVIGHITINADGTLKITTRPFSDLKFAFQYHAPSHKPGNNLPGFIAILD